MHSSLLADWMFCVGWFGFDRLIGLLIGWDLFGLLFDWMIFLAVHLTNVNLIMHRNAGLTLAEDAPKAEISE
jgi:hypothetical protein